MCPRVPGGQLYGEPPVPQDEAQNAELGLPLWNPTRIPTDGPFLPISTRNWPNSDANDGHWGEQAPSEANLAPTTRIGSIGRSLPPGSLIP